MSQPGEITFTMKFSGEDLDVLDRAAKNMGKTTDEMLAYAVTPSVERFLKALIIDLRSRYRAKDQKAPEGLLS